MVSDAHSLSSGASETFKVVAFDVAGHHFCIDIMSVREIRGWAQTTPLPHAPEALRGVVNLRGAVLPVVDLSSRLGFGFSDPTSRNGVIVVERPGSQDVGLLVDGVADILEIRSDEMQPTPTVGGGEAANFVQGIMATPAGLTALLKIDALGLSEAGCQEAHKYFSNAQSKDR